ncbi:MAG: N-acetyltransferase family protein [Bacteroidota bacterium]
MQFKVRPAVAEDVPAIHALIAELALYEKEPESFILTEKDLLEHGFLRNPPMFEVCLADAGPEGILGMAMVYTKYSSWRGPCLFLEDLVIRHAYRRRGLGKALLTEVLAMAADRHMDRVEWMVLDWNEPAHAFYRAMGAELLKEWWPYRVSGSALAAYHRNPNLAVQGS